jgi:hypothetical protein
MAANDTVTIPSKSTAKCVLIGFIHDHSGFITCKLIRVRNTDTAIKEKIAAVKRSATYKSGLLKNA